MALRQENSDVYFADAPNFSFTREDLSFLKQRAAVSPRKRARICAHQQTSDPVHEMLIVLAKGSYICPHKHLGKSESMQVLEGEVDFLRFAESGELEALVEMGSYESGKRFYHYMYQAQYHTLIVKSEFLVYHEVTMGPFRPEQTIIAPWAPDESRPEAGRDFLEQVLLSITPSECVP